MRTEANDNLVTVALPVYNEEKFIKDTLDSIINQDYVNLEILISDNASTDKTRTICLEYAAKDKRIKFHPNERNIGAAENSIYLKNKARGKYFVWAAGHDIWSPNLISECVQLLKQSPQSSIAYGTPVWIGEKGEHINKYSGWYDTKGCNTIVRFLAAFWGSMNPILGVIRRERLPDFSTNYNFVGSDLVLLTGLALKGDFTHAPAATFYRRQNRPAEDYQDKLNRYKNKDTKIANTFLAKLFPLAKLPVMLLRTVIQSDISLADKIFIITLLIPSLPIKYITGRKDNQRA